MVFHYNMVHDGLIVEKAKKLIHHFMYKSDLQKEYIAAMRDTVF